jgi:hypothetical protein
MPKDDKTLRADSLTILLKCYELISAILQLLEKLVVFFYSEVHIIESIMTIRTIIEKSCYPFNHFIADHEAKEAYGTS